MRRHPPSLTMMEGSDYYVEDEPLFHFDNEDDQIAAMDELNDMDLEPLTPTGSAEPTAPTATQAAAPGSGRLHYSSASAWQHPEHASPPDLSYSPSPRATPATQYRHQDRHRPPRLRLRQPSGQFSGENHDRLAQKGSNQSLGQLADRPSHQNLHHHDLAQLDQVPQHRQPDSHGAASLESPSEQQKDEDDDEDLDVITFNEANGFVEIPAEDYEAMFNGDEENRITAQKFQDEIVRAVKQNGKVVYMVGLATAQWWLSPEMSKRRRAAGRKMLDIGGGVATSAGSVIMNKTPLGRVTTSVSNSVTAFKTAPFRYTLQGLGIKKRNGNGAVTLPSSDTTECNSRNSFTTTYKNQCMDPEAAIAVDDALDEFEDEDGMGMFAGLGMDDDDVM